LVFNKGANAVVFGASGGIGHAMVTKLRRDERFDNVYCVTRNGEIQDDSTERTLQCDITNAESVQKCADALRNKIEQIDLLFIATGILHDDIVSPEKRLEDLSPEAMQHVFSVNTFAPVIVAKTFIPMMNTKHKSIIAALSARVGSIADNRLGGWHSYRASKAALNMYFKTLSIEMKRKNPNLILSLLHPGTTDTKLSKPFQKNVPEHKLFPPEQAVDHLYDVITGLEPDDSGKFYAWDGQLIEW